MEDFEGVRPKKIKGWKIRTTLADKFENGANGENTSVIIYSSLYMLQSTEMCFYILSGYNVL